jgi:hypothetical protein
LNRLHISCCIVAAGQRAFRHGFADQAIAIVVAVVGLTADICLTYDTAWKKMTTGTRQESIFVREADFAGVTEYRRVSAQVDFTDVGKVSASAGEPAGTSGNVQRIGENGE